MARGLDPNQKAELVAFLEELYRLGDYETQAQWAREAGYHTVNLSNALNRTKADGLDGYTLIKLMRAAAKRAETTPEAVARRLAADDQQSDVARRLEALEGLVAELPTAEDLKRLGESMRRAIARASQGTGAAPQATPRSRKAAK